LAVLSHAAPGTTFDQLAADYERKLGPAKLVQPCGPSEVRRVGICSGGSGAMIAAAAAAGCDTFLTGETSHANYHDAALYGLNLIWGGHYLSETVGVMALGEHLAERFELECSFVDLPTGV
jgi:putative NIF3 family GTP cyclohydrolase 1 type 2